MPDRTPHGTPQGLDPRLGDRACCRCPWPVQDQADLTRHLLESHGVPPERAAREAAATYAGPPPPPVTRPPRPSHAGEGNVRAKLTWAQVATIRASYRGRGNPPHHVLAKRFGVSTDNITKILNRDTWRED